jgi:hypothetical protein
MRISWQYITTTVLIVVVLLVAKISFDHLPSQLTKNNLPLVNSYLGEQSKSIESTSATTTSLSDVRLLFGGEPFGYRFSNDKSLVIFHSYETVPGSGPSEPLLLYKQKSGKIIATKDLVSYGYAIFPDNNVLLSTNDGLFIETIGISSSSKKIIFSDPLGPGKIYQLKDGTIYVSNLVGTFDPAPGPQSRLDRRNILAQLYRFDLKNKMITDKMPSGYIPKPEDLVPEKVTDFPKWP